MKQITIKCPTCEGRARVPLEEHLRAALDLVPACGSITAGEICGKLGITTNAASNRLMDLFLLGLVTRKCDGRYRRYGRKPNFGS